MTVSHAVGEVLGFQTESTSSFVGLTGLTSHTANFIVGGIKLNTGLGGQSLHTYSGVQAEGNRCAIQLSGFITSNDEVVVVAASQNHLSMFGVDSLSDGFVLGEVKGGAFHSQDLTIGDEGFTQRSEVICFDQQLLRKNIAFTVTV